MLNFEYSNPTKIIFGKDSVEKIGNEITKYGNKILLVTGGGSVKKMGLYDKVINELKKIDAQIFEVKNIQPNPKLSSVYEGIEICKNNDIEFILAVGGGSVIDAAKGIAAGSKTDIDIWEYYLRKHQVTDALPLGAVLTLAATGTEMNGNSVVTNWDTNEKLHIGATCLNPKFSILDPVNTYSVPKKHTVNGCIDIIIHVFEQYFSKTLETPLQDRLCESIIKTTIENTYKVLENPNDYDARANIMWSGTMALNNIVGLGKEQDWATHAIEHELSAEYDISHGAGLAILSTN
jgi:alcohol dehydrogenase YqhD (iron-dependent ADH family)